MSRVDNIALANKRNYVDKTRLLTEIHRIDREKCTVMRQLNNEKQRFKSKYSKFDILSEHRGREVNSRQTIFETTITKIYTFSLQTWLCTQPIIQDFAIDEMVNVECLRALLKVHLLDLR